MGKPDQVSEPQSDRDLIAKACNSLPPDERRELMALILKLKGQPEKRTEAGVTLKLSGSKSQTTAAGFIADARRLLQLFQKARLVSQDVIIITDEPEDDQ